MWRRYGAWKLNDRNVNYHLKSWKYFNNCLTKHYFTNYSQFPISWDNHQQDNQGWDKIPTVNLFSLEHYSVNSLTLCIDKQQPSKALKPDFEIAACTLRATLHCFLDLVSISQTTEKQFEENCTMKNYYCLHAFDMRPNLSAQSFH